MRRQWRSDEGGALVEFLGVTVVLMVPLLYAVVAVAHLQAATYAVEGSSRAAARGAALAALEAIEAGGSDAQGIATAQAHAQAAVELALEDFGVGGEPVVTVACGAAGCTGEQGEFVVTVAVDVPLPGIPGPVLDVLAATVNVSSHARAPLALLESP
ncbi:pilus assembly protein [Demequina sp.]|uniref:pilus assembly protein n=1 Tax=Demequina sp. TaxID=2050685 RepID=UPI003A893F4E